MIISYHEVYWAIIDFLWLILTPEGSCRVREPTGEKSSQQINGELEPQVGKSRESRPYENAEENARQNLKKSTLEPK